MAAAEPTSPQTADKPPAGPPTVEDRPARVPMCLRTRPWTPNERSYDQTAERWFNVIHVKRACNGCGVLLGDVTDAEMDNAMAGGPARDVRGECPYCSRGKA